MTIRETKRDRIFLGADYILLFLLALLFIYPIYFVLIASISNPTDVSAGSIYLLPSSITFEGYSLIMLNKDLWRGYGMALVYTVGGTLYSLLLYTLPTAYALSKKKLPGRGIVTAFFLITGYFGGGLIPIYMLVRNLGLLNKWYTLIVLNGFGFYNMVLVRMYIQNSIPESLFEAAEIDGASEFRCFLTIAIPLSVPVIAVVTLYYAVGMWNSYYGALIYLSDKKLYPLQLVLRSILIQNTSPLAGVSREYMTSEMLKDAAEKAKIAAAMKYGVIFIASLPMLILYPFIQKYFVKGIMIGSLKG